MSSDPFIAAARAIYEISATDLRSSIEGLGIEGLHWTPDAPDTNSAAILMAHAMGSARDWICIAVGAERPPRSRADEFLNRFDSEEQALALVDGLRTDTLRVFDETGSVDWCEVIQNNGQPGDPVRSRAYCLMHALEHLREHVAHLQLTRQLWNARPG